MIPYHEPVMLEECIQGLNLEPDGIYIDATFGGGGHSREILKRLAGGRLFGMDQDIDVKNNITLKGNGKFDFIQGNFRHVKRFLKLYGINRINGLLADLGISSHQIDVPERGFSTRFSGELDMRMDKEKDLTARMIINTYSREQLQNIFSRYGEIRNARKLADNILRARINRKINTTDDLLSVAKDSVPDKRVNKYFAQVFQALRLEVNDEIGALKDLLEQSSELIMKGGRLVVITYHSLEDRLVKNMINRGNVEGQEKKDLYGNVSKPFKPVNRKPITPSPDELKINPRARSAKLRIGEKI